MQQRRSASKNSTIRPRIELDLTAPNLTLLHRVGVVGLWMTLKQLEEQYPVGRRPGHLTWSLSPQRIELHWQGNDFDVLDWLFRQAFQINNDGLIALTGLAPQTLNIQTQLVIHQGITGTFLQHNQFLKTAGQATKILKIDDQEIAIKYKRAVSYAHQSFATTLCDRSGNLSTNPVRIVGWLYPGAVARHYRFADKTKFEETPELAFALLFAPIACRYFILPKQLQRGLAQYALVIPEVEDLEQYAICFWALKDLNYIDFYVAGMGDAGLKCLVHEAARAQLRKSNTKRCQVISFGQADWSRQQNTRTEVINLGITEEGLIEYQLSCEIFAKHQMIAHSNWWQVSFSYVHRIITENLAKGYPWWFSFSEYVRNQASLQEVSREREGLFTMIEQTQWDDQAKKLFVKACHEALRKTYAKIYSRTPEDEYANIGRKNQQLLSELNRCKDVHTFRHFINDFFARAGRNTFLQEHWEELLPLLTGEVDWRVARDLWLIAIASYPKSEKTAGAEQIADTQEHPQSTE